MVLDMAKLMYKENTTWLGMCGRDAVRKSTLKVNILQVFTIDFSVRNRMDRTKVQRVGWTCKRRPHFSSHSRGKEKVAKDNGILPRTNQAKNDLKKASIWFFEPLSWWKIAYTPNQENPVEERLHPGHHWRWHSSSSTSLWDKSEWNWKWAHNFFNCSNLFFVTGGFIYGR